MLLGKSILIIGPAGTGKTLLANHLKQLIESEGGRVVLLDDISSDFKMSQTRLEPEGTTTIVTVPSTLSSWRRNADVVIELNTSAFTDALVTLHTSPSPFAWGEEELHA